MRKVDPVDRALGKIRNHLLLVGALIDVASVMVFGIVEVSANVMVLRTASYQPVFMIGMIGPMSVVVGIIIRLRLMNARRRIAARREGGSDRGSRRPSVEAAIVAAAAAMAFLSIELYAHFISGMRLYSPVLLITMAVSVGIVMAPLCYFALNGTDLHSDRIVDDLVNRSSDGQKSSASEMPRRLNSAATQFRLQRRRVLESTAIVFVSVIAFGFVDYFANIVLRQNPEYQPINMIGMIGPMALVMGIASYAGLKNDSRYVSQLLGGMERVAGGDFDVSLDASKAGPFRDVFANFNTMCQELRSVQTLRDDFINQFSHEFKTPITSISGFAELLLKQSVSESERTQYLGIIAAESSRLAQMASNALMMSRLESQNYVVDKAPYQLDEQIRQCIILLSPQWSKKGLDVSADLAPAPFVGSADLLQQVWINILGNAVKFTPEGGRIEVELRRAEDQLVASVSDSGAGMTEEELAHIFEKYYQGSASRSSKGMGLGLAIAARIVALCGGLIDATSSPGGGSVFTVRLPLGDPVGLGAESQGR